MSTIIHIINYKSCSKHFIKLMDVVFLMGIQLLYKAICVQNTILQ